MNSNFFQVTSGFASSFARSIQSLGSRLAAGCLERRRRNGILRALEALPERELSDLGIGRGDFWAIATGTYDDRRQRKVDRGPKRSLGAAETADDGSGVILYFPPHGRRGWHGR